MSMLFQEIIFKLNEFWHNQGCIIQQPYDIEVGAGTMNPATFFKSEHTVLHLPLK